MQNIIIKKDETFEPVNVAPLLSELWEKYESGGWEKFCIDFPLVSRIDPYSESSFGKNEISGIIIELEMFQTVDNVKLKDDLIGLLKNCKKSKIITFIGD